MEDVSVGSTFQHVLSKATENLVGTAAGIHEVARALGRAPQLDPENAGATVIRIGRVHYVLYRSTDRDVFGYTASIDAAVADARNDLVRTSSGSTVLHS
jgi:hypothetical protein